MDEKVPFSKAAGSVVGSEHSFTDDTPSARAQSKAKRRVYGTTEDVKPQKEHKNTEKLRKRRKVSVYDAVAGRAGKNGFITREPIYSKNRDTASSSRRPIAPDDVLFNRKGARIRFAEEGDYVGIDDRGPIPPSDLLQAMHRYVSRFYDQPDVERKHLHYKSMDGTALLALGILLEEALEYTLGETGHLAFLTAEDEDETPSALGWDGHAWVRRASGRTEFGNGPLRSVRIDESPNEGLSVNEGSDLSENDYSDGQKERQETPELSYESEGVRKIEARVESFGNLQRRSPTNARTKTPPSLPNSSHEDTDNPAHSLGSSRRKDYRRLKRVYDNEGYKSAAMVGSSDEDDHDASISDGDVEMVDSHGAEILDHEDVKIPHAANLQSVRNSWHTLREDAESAQSDHGQHRSESFQDGDEGQDEDDNGNETESKADTRGRRDNKGREESATAKRQLTTFSPQPLTDSSSSSDSEDQDLESEPESMIIGRVMSPSRSLKELPNARPLSQGSRASRKTPIEESRVSSSDFEEGSQSEGEPRPGTAVKHNDNGASGLQEEKPATNCDDGESKDSHREEIVDEAETEDEEDDEDEDEGEDSENDEQDEGNGSEKGTKTLECKALVERPEDKKAKFKKDIDHLWKRLMAE